MHQLAMEIQLKPNKLDDPHGGYENENVIGLSALNRWTSATIGSSSPKKRAPKTFLVFD